MVKTIQRFNVRRMYSLLHIQFINIQKASTVHKYVTFDWKDRMSFYSVVGNWRLCLFVFQGKPVNRYVQFLVLSLSLFSPIEWQLIFKRLTTNSIYMFVPYLVGIFALCFRFIQTAYQLMWMNIMARRSLYGIHVVQGQRYYFLLNKNNTIYRWW